MNYQKDTSKTGANSYGQANSPSDNALVSKPTYEYISKKTEKLVTALYMVTDCMDTDDALKGKIRILGVELLSDTYKLSNLSLLERETHTSITLAHINEILSLIEISSTIGFISEMNTSILKRELMALMSELKPALSHDAPLAFTLDEKMFDVPRPLPSLEKPIKRTVSPVSFYKGQPKLIASPMDKEERSAKILKLIKEKREVSIKDISAAFTDCSEKTIQRELNSLVSKGQVKKLGAKRWSRYQAV